ncbi:NAD(P)H-binding protein [Kineosporia sp. R_H_3]|uniref:NAD(P)H-binding protein n=1 Tax=Kineosporia sp. R_H_3 TaxID=1961848 RepID=UPI000B4AC11C|nr:NAD(P)H-binding protein [Kineosporia sp. R_H_3]
MRIVVAGGHGKIARLLHPLLAARGDTSVGLVRNPAHVDDLTSDGARGVLLDLESATVEEVAEALAGADAAVFAAGAGPGSDPARTLTVDRDGAVKLADAAVRAGVPRLVQVSSMGTDDVDRDSDDRFQVYLGAKADADAHLRGTDLGWTVVRPGRLTDEPGTGLVEAGPSVARGAVPRADVAAVLAAVLADDASTRRQFEVVGGRTPVGEAVARLTAD